MIALLLLLATPAFAYLGPPDNPRDRFSYEGKPFARHLKEDAPMILGALQERAEKEGGWIGGGGGEGLICFATGAEADDALDEIGRLKAEYRAKLTKVLSYDIVEGFGMAPYRERQKGDNVRTYLDRVLKLNVDETVPYFGKRLRQAIDTILDENGNVRGWKDVGALPKIDDAGIRLHIVGADDRPGHYCRLAQIAIRYEKKSKGAVPDVTVLYDKDLYDRLHWMNEGPRPGAGVLHQSGLVMHEALFLMASNIGQKTSDNARVLVHFLLGTPMHEVLSTKDKPREAPSNAKRGEWLTGLFRTFGFDNHGNIFLEDEQEAKPFSKGSRRKAHASLEKKIRANHDKLHQQGVLRAPQGLVLSMEELVAAFETLVPQLTDEEAFLYLAGQDYLAERSPYPRDHFLLHELEDTEAMRWLCHHFLEDFIYAEGGHLKFWDIKEMRRLYLRATNYCVDAGALPDRPGPDAIGIPVRKWLWTKEKGPALR